MRYIGLSWEEKMLKVAILSDKGVIERLEGFLEAPLELLQDKSLYLVSGLGADKVFRRETVLKLQKHSAILKALPFQLEGMLPYDWNETIVHPILYPTGEGTDVVVFAVTRSAVQEHILEMQKIRIDPDHVTCIPLALARWARFLFPQERQISLLYDNAALVLDGDKVVFSQSFEDRSRLEAYLHFKFPGYFSVGDEGPSLQGYSYEKLREFAIPLGLALEGLQKENSCQLRQGDLESNRRRRKKRLLHLGSWAACLTLAALTGGIGKAFLYTKERALEERIAYYCAVPNVSLEEKISLWQKQLMLESKEFPLLPDVASVSQIMAWLGEVQDPIEIVQFHYTLVTYPKAGEKEEPYAARIDLEFKAAGPAAAQRLQETLQKTPALVDTKQKVSWTAQQDSYKISFWLRKS